MSFNTYIKLILIFIFVKNKQNSLSYLLLFSPAFVFFHTTNYEAIFRKAKSFEFIAQNTKALELYYQILTAPRPPLAINEKPEMNWHFKAGFECIRILTNRGNNQDLRAAIIIADQLANINGSRSPEAKVISERLKLENFIWDEFRYKYHRFVKTSSDDINFFSF